MISKSKTWERTVLFALISPCELSSILTARVKEKQNVSHFISVFHVHVASQCAHASTTFQVQFFPFFFKNACITLSGFFSLNKIKMQPYWNCNALKNNKLLGTLEMKGMEENEIWLMIRAGKGKHGQVVVLTLTVLMVFSLLTDVAVPAFKWNVIYSSEVAFLLSLVEDKSASLFSMTFPAQ